MPGTDPALQNHMPSVVVDNSDPLIGANLNGYIVGKVIAAGGMGIVYSAEHETIGRRVAVKVLKPEVAADVEWTKRFLVEARAIAALKHRNLIEVVNFGKTPDARQYLMMEFLEGEPLDAYMRRMGALPPAVALSYADQILNGLAEAHKKGVVHRDLKPSNVFLIREHNGDQLIKILDFGLARQEPIALVDIATSLPKRNDGSSLLAGTPEYIAPEQAEGKKVDDKADLYSLGIMLYEMLAGQLPFQSESVTMLLQKHLSERPPALSSVIGGLPEGVEEFVDSLLEKDPTKRPTSADSARMTVQRLIKRLSTDSTNVRHVIPVPQALPTVRIDRDMLATMRPTDEDVAKMRAGLDSAPSVFVSDETIVPGQQVVGVQPVGTAKSLAAAFPKSNAPKMIAAFLAAMFVGGLGWYLFAKPARADHVDDFAPEVKVPVVDAKPVDVKPVDLKPVDVKPVDVKAVDAKAVDVKPIDVKPVDVKAKLIEAKPKVKVSPTTNDSECVPDQIWLKNIKDRLDAALGKAAKNDKISSSRWTSFEARVVALKEKAQIAAQANSSQGCEKILLESAKIQEELAR
jgi:serine/threonine protein kinase